MNKHKSKHENKHTNKHDGEAVAPADVYIAHKQAKSIKRKVGDTDAALDEALKESFPAGDSVAVNIDKA